jgi:hypothetical protein
MSQLRRRSRAPWQTTLDLVSERRRHFWQPQESIWRGGYALIHDVTTWHVNQLALLASLARRLARADFLSFDRPLMQGACHAESTNVPASSNGLIPKEHIEAMSRLRKNARI